LKITLRSFPCVEKKLTCDRKTVFSLNFADFMINAAANSRTTHFHRPTVFVTNNYPDVRNEFRVRFPEREPSTKKTMKRLINKFTNERHS